MANPVSQRRAFMMSPYLALGCAMRAAAY